jgi:hypothetical protein
MNITRAYPGLVVGFALSIALQSAAAQPHGSFPPPPPHGPPPEAIDACDGAAEGDPCEFIGRFGERLTGECFAPPSPPIACLPAGLPPPPPPREDCPQRRFDERP